MAVVIGADIGGSHISCAAIDLSTETILEGSWARRSVNCLGTTAEIVHAWCAALRESMNTKGITAPEGIGIAMPGPFDYDHGISLFEGLNGKFGQTYGQPIRDLIREQLQLPTDFPIRFINDATAYAIGEATAGQTQSYARSIALTIGTGLGSAFIADELPVVGGEGIPPHGCLWHLPFGAGTVEDYFSTRGLANRYQHRSGQSVQGLKEIAEMASADAQALEVLEDYGTQLMVCLEPWLRSFALEGIVIGGNGSRAFHFLAPAMNRKLQELKLVCEISPTQLFEEAALLGASRLIDPAYYTHVQPLLRHLK